MKKNESELAITALASKWFETLPEEKREHPSFYAFKDWLSANHYSDYLRSRMGSDYDAETWFEDELGQNWLR